MAQSRRIVVAAAICLVVAAALRIRLHPHHLFSDDCVSFADAVEHFDPAMWRPQPPGYPLFVLQSKFIRLFAPSIERTFLAGVILGTAVALFMTLLLGREMFGSWRGGILSASLLLVNPTFVFTGLTSTIRCYLAAAPLVIAYFCWRLWRGDRSCWWMAALALGVGSGYRPELLVLLFPLWAVSAWRAKRTFRDFGAGLAIVAVSSGAWMAVLLARFGGLAQFSTIFTVYLKNQSRDSSPLFGAPAEGWLRMLGMLLAWNGVAAAGWLLFRWFARPRQPRGNGWFFAMWIAPPLLFHAIVHSGAPDQVLVTISAFCVLGGGVLAALFERNGLAGGFAIGFVLALNLVAFWRPPALYPFPVREGVEGNLLFLRKQVADGLWETSWECFRNVNEKNEAALANFRDALKDTGGQSFTVWNRSGVSWRRLAHYFPNETYCLLHDSLHADIYQVTAACWRGEDFLARYDGSPVVIPLGNARRIIWLLGNTSPARAALGDRLHPVGGEIYWTAAQPMDLPGYRFVR